MATLNPEMIAAYAVTLAEQSMGLQPGPGLPISVALEDLRRAIIAPAMKILARQSDLNCALEILVLEELALIND